MKPLLLSLSLIAAMAGCIIDHSEKFVKIIKNDYSNKWAIETGKDKLGYIRFVGTRCSELITDTAIIYTNCDTIWDAKAGHEIIFNDSFQCASYLKNINDETEQQRIKDSVRYHTKYIYDSIEKLKHTYK